MKVRLALAAVLLVAAGVYYLWPLASWRMPPAVPAGGVVRHGGQPVEGATVLFGRMSMNYSKGELAIGRTDSEGRFALTTRRGEQTDLPGALPGVYRVAIARRNSPAGAETEFPAKYSAMDETELRAEVVEGGPNEFTFDLD